MSESIHTAVGASVEVVARIYRARTIAVVLALMMTAGVAGWLLASLA